MNKSLLVIVALLVSFIFAFGWLKADENSRDNLALDAWRQRTADLKRLADTEREELVSFVQSLHNVPDAKLRFEDMYNDGKPLATTKDNQYFWRHPEYGIPVALKFSKLGLSGFTVKGPRLGRVPVPPPTLVSRTGKLESLRSSGVGMLPWLWLFAVVIAVFRPFRHIGTVAALVFSIAYCCAILVSPLYSITIFGIICNDLLVLGVLLYTVSVLAVSFSKPRTERLALRFTLRAALTFVTVSAIAISARPFGIVSMMFLMAGALVYVTVPMLGRNS